MKTKNLLIAVAFLLYALTACQKDPVSAVDPFPFHLDDKKDRSVAPGDDFYQYCCGAWLAQTPKPDFTPVGGLYSASPVMDERLEQLIQKNPQVGCFFNMMADALHHEDASLRYINEKRDAIVAPKSLEEAYRMIGKMLADGVPTLLDCYLVPLNGKVVLGLDPYRAPGKETEASEPEDLVPLTKADAASPLQLIAEGMGVGMDKVFYNPSLDAALAKIPLSEFHDIMRNGWKNYELYARKSDVDLEELSARARNLFNYPLSYYFAQEFVSASVKEKYLGLTRSIRDTFRKRLEKVDWMSETTRNNALKKLDAMKLLVAYPDEWQLDCIPDITDCKTFVEMAHRLAKAKNQLIIKLAGSEDVFTQLILSYSKSPAGGYRQMDLLMVNALYYPDFNSIAIYPAVMLPPVVKADVTAAADYAAFVTIGHEITHGFDSNGSKYDEKGNKRNWWTVADQMAFEERQQKLIRCYNHLAIDPAGHPGIYCDGARTLGENIADLGGFLTVLDAYKDYLTQNGYSGETYNEQLRKFYECYADYWCVQYSDPYWDILINTDVHAASRVRINGVVMNTALWYDLYKVNRNHILFLPEQQRTQIW